MALSQNSLISLCPLSVFSLRLAREVFREVSGRCQRVFRETARFVRLWRCHLRVYFFRDYRDERDAETTENSKVYALKRCCGTKEKDDSRLRCCLSRLSRPCCLFHLCCPSRLSRLSLSTATPQSHRSAYSLNSLTSLRPSLSKKVANQIQFWSA